MHLNDFSSYFEILVGINLGFAAITYFRNIIRTSVFKKNHLTGKLDDLLDRLTVQLMGSKDNPDFHKQLSRMERKVKVATDTLNEKEKSDQCFFDLLRPISFILSLLCVTYLILAGFQVSSDNQGFYCSYFFRLSCFVATYTFTIFYCTLSDRILKNKLDVKLFDTLAVFFAFTIISCDNVFLYFFQNQFWQIFGITFTPFLFYIISIAFRVMKLNRYKKKAFGELLKSFTQLCKQNFIAGIIFISIIVVSVIPVYSHNSKENNIIFYLIILSTPFLLYIFMFIRVWYHKYSFGKKYLALAKDHSAKLDFALVDEKEKRQEK